jgi:hypothetical protein
MAGVLASWGHRHRRVQRPGREADHLSRLMPKLRMNGAILPRRCMRPRPAHFIIRLQQIIFDKDEIHAEANFTQRNSDGTSYILELSLAKHTVLWSWS